MGEKLNIPTMLTIREVAELFKLPLHFVRSCVGDSSFVSVRAGRKFLVNAESVTAFLSTGKPQGAVANSPKSDRRSDEKTAPRVTSISLR